MTLDEHEEILTLEVFQQMDNELADPVKGGPMVWVLAQSRKEAAMAMRALIRVNPTDRKTIQRLQNEIVRQLDLADWLRTGVEKGRAVYMEWEQEQKEATGEFIRGDDRPDPLVDDEDE